MTMRKAIIENNVVTNIVEVYADSDWTPVRGTAINATGANIGDTWDGIGFVPPPVTPPAAKTLFDGAEFLTRLTDAEYSAILAASAQSIQLARWLDTFRLRGEIDVTGKTALAAKNGLVKVGLLTAARADEIFAAE